MEYLTHTKYSVKKFQEIGKSEAKKYFVGTVHNTLVGSRHKSRSDQNKIRTNDKYIVMVETLISSEVPTCKICSVTIS
jgi:hypothetical protein